MSRRPPESNRTDPLWPCTALFRSPLVHVVDAQCFAETRYRGGRVAAGQVHAQPQLAQRRDRLAGFDPRRLADAEPGQAAFPVAEPEAAVVLAAAGEAGVSQAPGDAFDRALDARAGRSEEHTSELQSLMRISYAVFCLKKQKLISRQDAQTKIYGE